MKVFYFLLFSLAVVLLGPSCASSQITKTTEDGVEIVYLTPPPSPPPSPSPSAELLPATYEVKKGDTLFTIARQFDLDYRELAKHNDIGENYIIVPGQVLYLTDRTSEEEKDLAQLGTTEKLEELKWVWPVPPNQEFHYSQNQKGLDINTEVGGYTLAAADGEIVYAGEELEEYGQLVLISHGQKYLSVYGHNGEILAKEGQKVSRGERIARPTIQDNKAYLYFEIRLGGESIDPLSLLPRLKSADF